MIWKLRYLPEALRDLQQFDHSQQLVVIKQIKKVQQNPLPESEGGYGKPLGHKRGQNLTGFLKIKLLKEGIRVVYRLIRTDSEMLIVVVGMRRDEEAYETASKRVQDREIRSSNSR